MICTQFLSVLYSVTVIPYGLLVFSKLLQYMPAASFLDKSWAAECDVANSHSGEREFRTAPKTLGPRSLDHVVDLQS